MHMYFLILDLIHFPLQSISFDHKMKTKFQDDAEESESNGTASNGNEIHWTQEDKEKGNLKKFEISKKTIKKLKGIRRDFLQ